MSTASITDVAHRVGEHPDPGTYRIPRGKLGATTVGD